MGRHIGPDRCHWRRPVIGQIASLRRGRSGSGPGSSTRMLRCELAAVACDWRSRRKLFNVSLLIQVGSLLLNPCRAQNPAQWFCLSCLWKVLIRWTSAARVSTKLAASSESLYGPIRLLPLILPLSALESRASPGKFSTASEQGTFSLGLSTSLDASWCRTHCLSFFSPCASSSVPRA